MAAAPKMASATAFIQEEAPDCSAATSKAYEKFKGDMAKITALKEKADGRANKAETEAQKQGGIARRCLAAEQLLSGDAKARREKLRAHIKKKLDAVKGQLAAKIKECKSAHDATNIARDQAKKASQHTAHAQLAAKAAETAERVQVIKEQNKVKRLQASEASEAKTIRNDKVALAKEKAALHEALSKDKRAESALDKERNAAKLASDKAADKEKALADKVSRLRGEKNAEAKKAQAEEIALAGAKSKAVAQQAKDAIAEGQTKGQLTVVLGKLKGDKATISELRKELVNSRKARSGGQGLELKAKLVEEEVKASQKEASRELTRTRAKEKLLELKVKEIRKRKNGYKSRLDAKSKLMQKQVDTKATELKVCMARSVGYQKQIEACIGAEKALKREELSMQALTKLSKEKLAGDLRKRRKQLAICQAKSTGLERHLQDKMVLKTKLESTERVLKEWKTTGKALQGQVHRLTLQRNQEMLKRQKVQLELD